MLLSLSIQNLVLMDHLTLEFENGMVAFTGETGAGKSMLLHAIDLLCGGKGDKSLLRNPEKSLSITATFKHTRFLENILHEHGITLDDEEDVILRRVLDTSGKSKSFVQSTPVPIASLRDVSSLLVEVHGQMDRLLKESQYRIVLDDYAGHINLLDDTKSAYHAWKSIISDFERHQDNLKNVEANLDRLRFEYDELKELTPLENEESLLEEKRHQLRSTATLRQSIKEAQTKLTNTLQPALYDLQSTLQKTKGCEEWSHTLDTMGFQLSDMEAALKSSLNGMESTGNLEDVEERLSLIKHLARKHKCRGDELLSVWEAIGKDIQSLEQSEKTANDLVEKMGVCEENYKTCAEILSQSRKMAAKILSQSVQKELPELKLEHALFEVRLEDTPLKNATSAGLDHVQFLFQANPGSTLQSLNKVASGGELSRLMLALKVAASGESDTSEGKLKTTLIFDEIDSGVGGAVAAAIGAKLRTLSKTQQILCITHAPQVAAYSHHHYRVMKETDGTTTETHVRLLSEKERQLEIARMLAGEEITPAAKDAATALLQSACV